MIYSKAMLRCSATTSRLYAHCSKPPRVCILCPLPPNPGWHSLPETHDLGSNPRPDYAPLPVQVSFIHGYHPPSNHQNKGKTKVPHLLSLSQIPDSATRS